MKRFSLPLMLTVAALMGATAGHADDEVAPVLAQQGPSGIFVDADGDGINDNAPDADGDGVVNHLDDDYAPQGNARGQGARGQYLDEDGDGLNDLAPDANGDGIPNGMDADYVRRENGGQGNGRGLNPDGPTMQRGWKAPGNAGTFVDLDGDGINDNAPDADGDGVVNHLDDDYAPQGTAQGNARGQGAGGQGQQSQKGGKGQGRK